MKVNNISIIALLAIFFLSSCDKKKSQVEEQTKAFVEAIKTKDVATIYDMYPDAKLLSNMNLPTNIQMADVDVVKDETTGDYTATIKNQREQKLVFKVMGENEFKIVDSYNLLEIYKDYINLAVKSGVPLKALSDQKLKELLKEDSPFIAFIKDKFKGVTDFKLSSYDGIYNINPNANWINIEQNIKNDGEFRVKGTDYNVSFHFVDMLGECVSSTKTIAGVDLEPGESFTYSFQLNGYESSAYNRSLSWTVTFDQKRGGTMEDMLKKAKFTGTEYDEYIQNNKTKK